MGAQGAFGTRWGSEHRAAFCLYVKKQLVSMSVVTLTPPLANSEAVLQKRKVEPCTELPRASALPYTVCHVYCMESQHDNYAIPFPLCSFRH